MANLFWKTPVKTTRLLDTPFKGEEEFERLVFATPEILEDKLPEAEARDVAPKMTRCEHQWKQALYYVEPGKTAVGDFAALLDLANRRLTGR